MTYESFIIVNIFKSVENINVLMDQHIWGHKQGSAIMKQLLCGTWNDIWFTHVF